jgi:hypothetical protein
MGSDSFRYGLNVVWDTALHTVGGADDSRVFRTVDAAEKRPVMLDSVADDSATTMGTLRRQSVNGALKAIKGVRLSPPW